MPPQTLLPAPRLPLLGERPADFPGARPGALSALRIRGGYDFGHYISYSMILYFFWKIPSRMALSKKNPIF